MFKQEYLVSNNDVDTKYQLKVSAIFRFFQDVALLATEEAKVDSMSLSKKNIDWVITRMAVEIKRLPKCNELIYVHTYPGKDMAMLYPRYFYITDKEGNVLIRSSSIWALINNETRKVIVDRDVISKLPAESREDQLPLPEKISVPEVENFLENRTIHYSDLDFNAHMNNVRYVELIMDVHESKFYQNNHPSFILLNYMKEIKEKETVSIFTNASNPEIISVKSNDALAFLGKVSFIND